MASALFPAFPAATRQAWSSIAAGVSRGLSASAIHRSIIEGGGRASLASVRDAARIIRRTETRAAGITRIGDTTKIRRQSLGVRYSVSKYAYSFLVKVNLRDTITNAITSKFISVVSNNLDWDKEGLLETAADIWDEGYGKNIGGASEVHSFEIQRGYINVRKMPAGA